MYLDDYIRTILRQQAIHNSKTDHVLYIWDHIFEKS
jgi:hypothetical protein